ncbi:hypothetical protein CBL_20369 [Carabus blaptoides fortunei]
MHRYKSYRGFQGQTNNLILNGTTTASVTLAGQVEINGQCSGAIFIENGITWKDVVGTDFISLQGGVTCPYTEGYCTDTMMGETTWDLEQHQGCDQYDNIYTGTAYIVNTKNQDGPITEHLRLLVANNYRLTNSLGGVHKHADIDLTAYVNSKFLYVEQAYKRALDQLYADSVHRRWLLRTEILNRIITTPLASNAVSALIKNHLGYEGRVYFAMRTTHSGAAACNRVLSRTTSVSKQ